MTQIRQYKLLGLVVRAEDLPFDSYLADGDFSGLSHTSDLPTGTLEAIL